VGESVVESTTGAPRIVARPRGGGKEARERGETLGCGLSRRWHPARGSGVRVDRL